MANECDISSCEKVFGNCEVCWKIKDFSLAECAKNYSIKSSDFCVSGPTATTWKLIFIPRSRETSMMKLCLERQDDLGPRHVFLSFLVTVGSLNEVFFSSELNEGVFLGQLTRITYDLGNISRLMSHFEAFGCDTLIIRYHLIVDPQFVTTMITEPKTLGLKCLSEDLSSMHLLEEDNDFALKVGDIEILVHKAVLCRNAVLRNLIDVTHDDILEFPDLHPEAVRRYIDFLYTGDLNKILKNPSISVHKCLEVMDRDLLKRYFALEEIQLHTQLEIEESTYVWIIHNFSSVQKENGLKSPIFTNNNLDTTWQLTIDLQRIKGIYYWSVFAEGVAGNKPSKALLEFAVEDSEREIYYPSIILSTSSHYGSLKIDEFLKKDFLENFVVDDTLNLVFRVRTWKGEYCSKIVSRRIPFITRADEVSYGRLSKTLLNVYQLGIHTDITIQVENKSFGAHKCILSARSLKLSSTIEDLKDKKFLTLNDITPHLFNLLLEYIYSGNLVELNRQTLNELCEAAKAYKISSLVKECQQRLETSETNASGCSLS